MENNTLSNEINRNNEEYDQLYAHINKCREKYEKRELLSSLAGNKNKNNNKNNNIVIDDEVKKLVEELKEDNINKNNINKNNINKNNINDIDENNINDIDYKNLPPPDFIENFKSGNIFNNCTFNIRLK